MTRRLAFEVRGELPPKKDGSASLWRKGPEVPRVIRLRLAAYEALQGAPPLDGPLGLTLVVCAGRLRGRAAGDLDNYVTGVLDALQAAAPNTPWRQHDAWQAESVSEVLPDRAIGLIDDASVESITATRVDGSEPWYRVELSGVGA